MDKKVVFTVVLVIIGLSSLAFGALSFGLINLPQKQDIQKKIEIKAIREAQAKAKKAAQAIKEAQAKKAAQIKKETQTKNDVKEKKNIKDIKPAGPMAAWVISDSEKERGIQKALSEKSKQVAAVWATLKVLNGVINVLQSVQIGGSAIVEASVNPMEFLSPIDNVLDKISTLLLLAFGAIIFEKVLLAISGYIVLFIIIPVCVIISIVTLWTNNDKSKVNGIIVVSVLISLILMFAIPISFYVSSFIEKTALTHNVNKVLYSITEKGNTAAKMEKELTGLRRIGSSVTNYLTNTKNLGNALVEDMINYFIIFVFTNIVIPILTIFGLYFLARYSAKMILKK